MTTLNKILPPKTSYLEKVLPPGELLKAYYAAHARGIELEWILLNEFGVSREDLLKAKAPYYRCPPVEYDERLPVPPQLIEGLNSDILSMSLWIPLILDNGKIIIASSDPSNLSLLDEVESFMNGREFEIRLALQDDIRWYIQDFLHAPPERLIGSERTNLAFWRNTMAQWRTRLACYRTDLAKARTWLAILRWGLGLVVLSNAFTRIYGSARFASYLYWVMVVSGMVIAGFGLVNYLAIRKSRMSPPKHHTIVEVTSATMQFLEHYHLDDVGTKPRLKSTMLSRLGDFIMNYCTILKPVPASRERTHLARERNVLAAQRSIAACYRTIYARARTGLAFIRTGVIFMSIGIGFIKYFSISFLTLVDILLLISGLLMIIDGTLWYLPSRKEPENLKRVRTMEGSK
ncbi:hypothetical protein BMS3Bbin09_00544 [bacterium BMS3Bbin09]|nr:hypothetical protein BMS3Bbin09_00544 [bacterium BMS3Bbin09]HDH34556.1 type II secretion protein [Nitrospirota bacterium]